MNAPLPLLDLLGARWRVEAPITAVCWAAAGDHVAFATGDGRVVIARRDWPDGPALACGDDGRLAVKPLRSPPPAPCVATVHDGACLSLAADPDGGFLSGGDDGALYHVSVDGSATRLAGEAGRWVDAIAAAPNGRVYARGRDLVQLDCGGAVITLPSGIIALQYDGTGQRLAIGHHGAITLLDRAGVMARLPAPGLPRSLAFSPEGRYLVAGLQENRLAGWRLSDGGTIEIGGYPSQPRSLSFLADGRLLATSGAPTVVCWPFDPPRPGDGPLECGAAGKAPVQCVACHPRLPLIAAGHHNGSVALLRPASAGQLLLRAPGGGVPTALSWSPDGGHLALANGDGELAVLPLPMALFRDAAESIPTAGALQ